MINISDDFKDLKVCEFLQEEQEAIMRTKEESGEKKDLSWADTKKMPITSRVIQETLRVASILSFTFREAVEDVEFEGQLRDSFNIIKHTHTHVRSLDLVLQERGIPSDQERCKFS